jgi:hypothetical protein
MRVAAVCGFLLATLSCGSPAAPSDTGLTGTVYRGPVTPVCTVSQPCDSAFAASFTVLRGSTRVATFQSDQQGHYEVRLPPGNYTIVPDADAPIMSPKSQTRGVTVGQSGITTLDLHFDTGIR